MPKNTKANPRTKDKINPKTCPQCHAVFPCELTEVDPCWCANTAKYPPIFEPDPTLNCLCPTCLDLAIKDRIGTYMDQMTPEKALLDNFVKKLPKTAIKEGIDYYLENNFMVFTAWFHLKRGHCCKNKCRHCPYGIHDK